MSTENKKLTIQDLIEDDTDMNYYQVFWNKLYSKYPFDSLDMMEAYYSPW
jgi:hypothetical protein